MSEFTESPLMQLNLNQLSINAAMEQIRNIEVENNAEKLPEVVIDGASGQEHAFMRLHIRSD